MILLENLGQSVAAHGGKEKKNEPSLTLVKKSLRADLDAPPREFRFNHPVSTLNTFLSAAQWKPKPPTGTMLIIISLVGAVLLSQAGSLEHLLMFR